MICLDSMGAFVRNPEISTMKSDLLDWVLLWLMSSRGKCSELLQNRGCRVPNAYLR